MNAEMMPTEIGLAILCSYKDPLGPVGFLSKTLTAGTQILDLSPFSHELRIIGLTRLAISSLTFTFGHSVAPGYGARWKERRSGRLTGQRAHLDRKPKARSWAHFLRIPFHEVR